jgi:hypothetical protein
MLKISTATLSATLSITAFTASSFAADAAHPTVLELFQSQGCSSCPPAQAILNSIADRPDLIALSFAVTYWDRLGWKDVFAQPAFTNRQSEYADFQRKSNVFTPQMIVNGRGILVGSDRSEVESALKRYDRGAGGPQMSLAADKITIDKSASSQAGTVWVAYYDPRLVNVPVRAGENNGRTLPHKNIVRNLSVIGSYSGAAISFNRPPEKSGLKAVVLLQAGTGGPIISAQRI